MNCHKNIQGSCHLENYEVNLGCSDWWSCWYHLSTMSIIHNRNGDDSRLLTCWLYGGEAKDWWLRTLTRPVWYISRTQIPISISIFLNVTIHRVYLCYKSFIYYANIYSSFFCFRTICNYVIWRFIKDLVIALPERFRDLETEYQTVYTLTLTRHIFLCKYLSVVGWL